VTNVEMLAKCLTSALLQYVLLNINLQACEAKIPQALEKSPSKDLGQAACEGAEECDTGLNMLQHKTLNQKSPRGMREPLDVKDPVYFQGQKLKSYCPAGSRKVSTEQECKNAALQMGKHMLSTSYPYDPNGCTVNRNLGDNVQWNSHAGAGRIGNAFVCVRAPVTTTTTAAANEASEAGCIRPQGWCIHSDAQYAVKDCDGDGVADPYCTDIHVHTGFIPSAGSCKDTWPGGTCLGETGNKCARPQGWCIHSGAHYAEQDCDGDGVADPYCTDGQGSKGFIPSARSCKDTWPGGTCGLPEP